MKFLLFLLDFFLHLLPTHLACLFSIYRLNQNRSILVPDSFCSGKGNFLVLSLCEQYCECDNNWQPQGFERKFFLHPIMKNFRLHQAYQRVLHLHRDWITEKLLCYKKNVVLIFKCFVKFNTCGMVKTFQRLYLVDKNLKFFYVLFGNFFDSSLLLSSNFFFCLIDNTIGTFA